MTCLFQEPKWATSLALLSCKTQLLHCSSNAVWWARLMLWMSALVCTGRQVDYAASNIKRLHSSYRLFIMHVVRHCVLGVWQGLSTTECYWSYVSTVVSLMQRLPGYKEEMTYAWSAFRKRILSLGLWWTCIVTKRYMVVCIMCRPQMHVHMSRMQMYSCTSS